MTTPATTPAVIHLTTSQTGYATACGRRDGELLHITSQPSAVTCPACRLARKP